MTQRKYFGTDGIRGRVGVEPITPEFMLKLGWAVGKVLGNGPESKVLIGKDTRISGYLFESALEAGLCSAGVNIGLLGPTPTPGIAYLTRSMGAQAGIVISASHNPYYDNGVKFFSGQGFKLDDAMEKQIEEYLNQPLTLVAPEKLGKATKIMHGLERYGEYCRSTIPAEVNLQGLKIVIDAAHGATYNVAPQVLEQLGATVIPIGVAPDGLNINVACGSTSPTLLQETVLAEKADLGIAHDGDGDRVIMVDHHGEVVDGDQMLLIIAKHYQRQQTLRGGVVGTVMSNLGLEVALKDAQIEFVRSKVGDRYVLESLLANQWQLGGESSGHIIDLGVSTTGDGIVSALQVLAAICLSGRSLHELKAEMLLFPQTMINVHMPEPQDPLQKPQIQAAVKEAESQLGEQGRVLLRPSGTEPCMRVMVEGVESAQVERVATELAAVVEQTLAVDNP